MAKNSDGQLDIFNFDSQSLNQMVRGKRLRNQGFLLNFGDPAYRFFKDEFRRRISYNIPMEGITAYGRILSAVTSAANEATGQNFTNI